MARCERRSPQHFRGEVESWGDHYFDPCSSREEDATEAPVVTEPAENAPMAGETGAKAVLESVETGTGGPPKIDRRARLAELGEDGAWLYAVLAKDGREAVSPLVSKKHKPFLRFVIEKLKTGVIRPHISNSPVFHAGTLVNELHRSFSREMIFSRRGGDKPNAKAIGLFMEHFDLVQRAAELGWTYPDFLRATKGASMMKATSAAEVWARQPTSTTVTGELPKTASLQDGTELEPAPIFVCGVCLFPSEARKELRYVDAYMHAHDCRQLVSEMNTHSVKEIGMHLAHRGLQFAREYKDLGQFLSTIGTAIQSRGETMDRALWFKLEPFRNRTTT